MALPVQLPARELSKFVLDSNGNVAVNTVISGADIQIGAVEIKDANSTNRAVVDEKGHFYTRDVIASLATAGNASVGTTPVQILSSATAIIGSVIQNISNTTVYISVATNTCNASLSIILTNLDELTVTNYIGSLFASVNAGSGEIRFLTSLL